MRMWWTLPELASRTLPGLPTSKQGLIGRAEKERWADARRDDGEPLARKRTGRGGGLEYHVSLLPTEARIALDMAAAPAAATDELVTIPAAACATGMAIRDARLAVLAAARKHREETGLPQDKADEIFAAAYNAGQMQIDTSVTSVIKTVSRPALYRWRHAARSADGTRLGTGHGGARREKVIEIANGGAVAIRVQRLITEQPFLTANDLRMALAATYGDTLDVGGKSVALPSVTAIARYAAEWKAANKPAIAKLTDPDGYRSKYRVTGGSRHGGLTRLNEVWQIDASPADILCKEDGKPSGQRYTIYVCIDIWSRRIVVYVSKTPRAEAVLLLLRKAILSWGVPDVIETDNGSDFRAGDTQRFLAATGIAVDYCTAYSPWQKGHVERVIGTVQRSFGVWQPGFIGHSVADRKKIEARKSLAQRRGESPHELLRVEMTAAELQTKIDAWAANGYAHDEHSALGMSPYAKALSYQGATRRIDGERALDLLLHKVPGADGLRTVGKDGIRLEGSVFICLSLMPGEKVLVRMDPADLGRIRCFSPDGAQYLGEAICAERLGLDRAEITSKWRAAVEQKRLEGLADIRRDQREIKFGDIAARVARQQAERAGKLVPFPRASDTHATPSLDAAAEASRPRGRAPEAKLTPEQQERHAAMVADFAKAEPARVVPLKPAASRPDAIGEKKARFRRFLALKASADAGDILTEDDAHFVATYPTLSEYSAIAAMVSDFGPAWLDGPAQNRAAN